MVTRSPSLQSVHQPGIQNLTSDWGCDCTWAPSERSRSCWFSQAGLGLFMEEDRVLEMKQSQDPGTPPLGYRLLFGKQIFQHACYFSDCGHLIVQPESCCPSGARPPDSCSGLGRGCSLPSSPTHMSVLSPHLWVVRLPSVSFCVYLPCRQF